MGKGIYILHYSLVIQKMLLFKETQRETQSTTMQLRLLNKTLAYSPKLLSISATTNEECRARERK